MTAVRDRRVTTEVAAQIFVIVQKKFENLDLIAQFPVSNANAKVDSVTFLHFRLLQRDVVLGLALRRRIVGRDPLELVLRSAKLKRRPVHSGGKSGELHLPFRVGPGFEIKPADSTKAIGDVHFDCGSINWFAVSVYNGKFEVTGTGSAIHDGDLFVVRLPLSRQKSDCDENGAQNVTHPVHIRTLYERGTDNRDEAKKRQLPPLAEIRGRNNCSQLSGHQSDTKPGTWCTPRIRKLVSQKGLGWSRRADLNR